MRVTNNIKDYIHRQVEEILPMPSEEMRRAEQDAVVNLRDKLTKKVNAFRDRMNASIEAEWKEFVKANPDLSVTKTYSTSCMTPHVCLPDWVCQKEVEIRKRDDEIYNLRRKKVDEIIISLELGGTKADLDAMLQALRDEIAG